MDACQHFGFKKPPFDPIPDAEFFYDAPAHAEALAMLQYAVRAHKGCCVVTGESGSGKTLVARLIAMSAGATMPILWVHGCGQPDNATRASVYPPGRFGCGGGLPVDETTLDAEMHTARFVPEPPLLVVDCADELPPHAWRELNAWLSNDIRYPKPLNVLLFGLPELLEILAVPELVRLRQRIFRVCRLGPLSPQLTSDYIRARSVAAGGEPRYIFSDATIARIGQLAQGNPALINRLCDNALLEAFGEGRDYVGMSDVGSAFHASFAGTLMEHAALPEPSSLPLARPALPTVEILTSDHSSQAALDASQAADGPTCDVLAVEPDDFSEIEMRLQQFEQRLSHALRVARQACGRPDDIATVAPALEDGWPVDVEEDCPGARPDLVEAAGCR
jgi:type II secretory pathway predicted ATPase ExeA